MRKHESIRQIIGWVAVAMVVGGPVGAGAQQQASVNLKWDAPITGPAPDGYRMYRGATCDALSPLNALNAPIVGLAYSDTTVVKGQTYCYKASSIKGSEESVGRSNAVTITVPNPVQPPGNLTCTLEIIAGTVAGTCVVQ